LTLLLTVWQVNNYVAHPSLIEYGIRLFFWIVVGLLVIMLMYGRRVEQGERSASVRQIGLLASVINLIVWAGITYWFFVHYAELHGK
ncbi:MAG: hypothetical protein ACK496_19745, partial [Acidobacteriota bacterium]